MLYTDSGSPIPNDKPMEQFKASDDDWRQIGVRAKNYSSAEVSRAVLELRDRVAKLEKKARTAEKCNDAICRRLDEIRRKEPAAIEESSPDRVLVRSQTGEYLRAGTPVYADPHNRLVSYSVGEARPMEECGKDHAVPSPAAAPAAAVPSDEELWEVQLKVKSQSRPHIDWQVWSPESEPLIAAHRALYNYGYERGQTDGYEQGLAAGRAEQQATTEPATKSEPEPSDFQTLHGIALDMVDSLRPIVIPEILNVLRRAIREPMAEQQAAAEATPEPEPSPSPAADGGLLELIADLLGHLGDGTARDVIRAVARWLRSKGYPLSAFLLEQEANR